MFEIYRDTHYNQKYRVVYYTELNEHNKHSEINRAMTGNSYYGGFIKEYGKDEAKRIIEEILVRLNSGTEVSQAEILELLKDYTP